MAEHIRASVSPAPASGHVLNQYNWPGFCMACNEAGKVFSLLFLNSGQPVRVALKSTAVKQRGVETRQQRDTERLLFQTDCVHFIALH